MIYIPALIQLIPNSNHFMFLQSDGRFSIAVAQLARICAEFVIQLISKYQKSRTAASFFQSRPIIEISNDQLSQLRTSSSNWLLFTSSTVAKQIQIMIKMILKKRKIFSAVATLLVLVVYSTWATIIQQQHQSSIAFNNNTNIEVYRNH